ncbi:molybdenum cofactor guanylyltransferase MobA [Tepidamorphus sp. 3E244]|uniref:molybdenum cofactor guanylyltransferase MobA n=1 Tax=Tepidamorphus sp. 3E244 TaxID=3385498 RepID=UPI0038FCF8A9
MSEPTGEIAGVILAGGLSRRMGGGDKPLLDVGGQPMLARVIDRLKPQVGTLALNANGDPARFAEYALPVVPDPIEGFAGPLAGVLAGLRWGEEAGDARYVLSAASDTPFFPRDLASRLLAKADGHDRIVLAESDGRVHPVFGLWPVAFADDLEDFLTRGETRKVLAFVDRHDNARCAFDMIGDGAASADPFFNVNTPEEIATAEALAAAGA